MATTPTEDRAAPRRVLVAGPAPARLREAIAEVAADGSLDVVASDDLADARWRLRSEPFDAVVVSVVGDTSLMAPLDLLLRDPGDTDLLRRVSSAVLPTPLTAHLLGEHDLRTRHEAAFDEFVQRYGDTLEHALEQDAHGQLQRVSAEMRRLANALGEAWGTPRDLIDIHLQVLRERIRSGPPNRAAAYRELGRVVVLEVMGYLAAYYRRHAVVSGSPRSGPDEEESAEASP